MSTASRCTCRRTGARSGRARGADRAGRGRGQRLPPTQTTRASAPGWAPSTRCGPSRSSCSRSRSRSRRSTGVCGKAGAVHLPPSSRERGAHAGADVERGRVRRVRDRRDRRPRTALACADERDRGTPRGTGGSDVPGEAPRWSGAASRRRARGRAGGGGGDRRGNGRLQRRRHRARPWRRGDDPRALDRSDAAPRGGSRLARDAADVLEPPDSGIGGGSGCGRRSRPDRERSRRS